MADTQDFIAQTKALVDKLKSTCAQYGLGNDGNEYKIIVQIFLYKFLNDKFAFEVKEADTRLKNSENWEEEIKKFVPETYYGISARADGVTFTWKDKKSGSAATFSREKNEEVYKDDNVSIKIPRLYKKINR